MMQFDQVPRLPPQHLRAATLQDESRLWKITALGDSISLHSTGGGMLALQTMSVPVARAVAREILACVAIFEGDCDASS